MAGSAAVASQGPADVLRFYEPSGTNTIRLVDNRGVVVHTWPVGTLQINAVDALSDGTLLRNDNTVSPGVSRLGFDGTVLWNYRSPGGRSVHHDLEPLPNGNVLLLSRDTKSSVAAIARGREPASVPVAFDVVSVFEVQPTGPNSGRIVWDWHLWDHLVQDFDPTKANYGPVGDHPELVDINFPVRLLNGSEFNHGNGIDYDPIHDWVVISSPAQNEIWIIDHSTTTAEAAGHTGGRWGKGGDLLYRWGNPQVYRAGPPSAQQLYFQHDPQFVPPGYPGAGHVTIFNNKLPGDRSEVLEIVLPVDASGNFVRAPQSAFGPVAPVWSYRAPDFFSQFRSGAERLPNGNTLICSSHQNWVFEVTPAGQRVWEDRTGSWMFHAHHMTRSMWADRESLSATAGGVVSFNVEAGSARAGEAYVMLGSLSGTTPGFSLHGVQVPLNIDAYLTGLLGSVGTGIYSTWVGALDSKGGASATYALPPLPFLSGVTFNHAALTIDTSSLQLIRASNAVPLRFTP